MDIKIDKNTSKVDRIIKRRIDHIARGYQNKIETALESRNMDGKLPIRKRQYGDPEIRAHKLLNNSREDKIKKKIDKDNVQEVLK